MTHESVKEKLLEMRVKGYENKILSIWENKLFQSGYRIAIDDCIGLLEKGEV